MILRPIGEDHVGPNASTYIPEPGLTTDKAPSPSLTGVCDSTTWSEAKSPVRLKSDLYTVLFPTVFATPTPNYSIQGLDPSTDRDQLRDLRSGSDC